MIQKYSGAGNKFIILNNLSDNYKNYKDEVFKLTSENKEIDGVIFLEKSLIADFKMNYFNRDGSGNALCGNGLRCIMKYIADNKISSASELYIEAVSKVYTCNFLYDEQISVSFPPPIKIKTNFKLKVHFQESWDLLNCSYVDCGSPHIVVFIDEIEKPKVKNLDEVNINEWGKNIRMHKDFMPEGANVNFVNVVSKQKGEIEIRSYERGVEAETLACGTGAISSALVFFILREQIQPIKVLTRSGEYLTVDFELNNKKLKKIELIGAAHQYE